ncbi:MAG TPA: hypothetical protein PK152_18315, partial [Anaerolineales bacterium]|nr:hypothetical protein [Anaerolineales bacterium]
MWELIVSYLQSWQGHVTSRKRGLFSHPSQMLLMTICRIPSLTAPPNFHFYQPFPLFPIHPLLLTNLTCAVFFTIDSIRRLSVEDAKKYLAEGQFGKG